VEVIAVAVAELEFSLVVRTRLPGSDTCTERPFSPHRTRVNERVVKFPAVGNALDLDTVRAILESCMHGLLDVATSVQTVRTIAEDLEDAFLKAKARDDAEDEDTGKLPVRSH
jgi:hypothetical protein